MDNKLQVLLTLLSMPEVLKGGFRDPLGSVKGSLAKREQFIFTHCFTCKKYKDSMYDNFAHGFYTLNYALHFLHFLLCSCS